MPTLRSPIESAAAWASSEVADHGDWSLELNDDQRNDIVQATRRAIALRRTTATVERDDFDIASIRTAVHDWVHMLNDGCGFVLV